MNKWAYYNEWDPYCAQWIRNLIKAGHVAPGEVDERSIEDVRPDDLKGFCQVHMFAGIAVWSHSLRLAGWPDDRPIWTGSCPCQPFSTAGKGAGFDDERHLWPAFHHLIKECKPPKIFGEQVASKDANPWIDLVHADLEAMGYAFGCVPFPSAGIGAPHIRDRTYWLADADDARLEGRKPMRQRSTERASGKGGMAGWMADTNNAIGRTDATTWNDRDRTNTGRTQGASDTQGRGESGRLVDSNVSEQITGRPSSGEQSIYDGDRTTREGDGAGPTNGFWRDADWLACTDGFWRPAEPGTFPLVNGAPARVVRVCAACLQKGSIDENVRKLLEDARRHEGRRASEVLFQGVHGSIDGCGANDARERAVSSAAHVLGNAMQSMPVHIAAGTAPSGREPDEQCTGEYRNPLQQVSPEASRTASADINLRGLRSSIHGEVTQKRSQSVLCDVCGRVGEDLRQATLVGNRTGKLRAYGNAINAQQAAEFIRVAA